ncbi:hypothetical protein [Nonlabens sp.]|nr:hypothetical protein [Nonlabens sp.]
MGYRNAAAFTTFGSPFVQRPKLVASKIEVALGRLLYEVLDVVPIRKSTT